MKYCPSCGEVLTDAAVICPKCGTAQPAVGPQATSPQGNSIPTADIPGGGNNFNNGNPYSGGKAQVNTDFSSLSPYYQERFQKIKNSNEQETGGWNWCAFLFGSFWALSKGCWLSAVVVFILTIVLGTISSGILCIVVSIAYGLRGNYLYYRKFVKNEQNIL